MCKGSSTTHSTSTSRPSAPAWDLYNSILRRADDASRQPYEPYSGQMVAGFTPEQRSAFRQINNVRDDYQPYLKQASQYAQQGASSITPEQIQGYENPYQQMVIDATMANINETNAAQQNSVVGNAVAKGAWGGDRAGIAQAELARNQGLASNQTFAGLNAQNYQQALAAAQADRAAAAQGAYTFGNLGQLGQSLGLQGAGAEMQVGNLKQQYEQSKLNVPYQQYLEQRAYPFQTLQFLSGIGTGVGSQMGGTQNSATTTPAPSPFSQFLGGGLALGSIFGGMGGFGSTSPFSSFFSPTNGKSGYAAGGAVEPSDGMQGFAEGGIAMPFASPGSPSNFIPAIPMTPGRGAPQMAPPTAQPQQGQMQLNSMVDTALGLADKIRKGRMTASAHPPMSAMPAMDMPQAGMMEPFADGGFVGGGMYLPRFADGGAPEPYDQNYFDQTFGDVPPAPAAMARPLAHAINDKYQPDYPIELAADPITRSPDAEDDALLPAATPTVGPAPGIDPVNVDPEGDDALTEFSAQSRQQPSQDAAPAQSGFFTPDIRRAMLSTGLALMASKSPFFGQAVGEAGLAGVQSYDAYQKQQQDAAKLKADQTYKDKTLGISERRVQMQADQLAQHAKQVAAQLALQTRNVDSEITHRTRQETRADQEFKLRERQASVKEPKYEKIKDAAGNETLVRIVPDPSNPQGFRAVPVVAEGATPGQQGNPYATGKFTETQGKAATFADRMAESHKTLDELEKINSGRRGTVEGVAAQIVPDAAFNFIASDDRQRFTQAKRNFVNAILRRESGAAISASEFKNAEKQYFPQPGDSPDVLAQKRKNRIDSTEGNMREAGPAYKPPAGWSGPGTDQRSVLEGARKAIAEGKDRDKVIERVRSLGIDPKGL